MCEPEKYIFSMKIQYENDVLGDDTAVNGMAFKCADLEENYNEAQTREVYSGCWGRWKEWSVWKYNYFVCAAKAQFEDYLEWGNNTALNGLRLKLCAL